MPSGAIPLQSVTGNMASSALAASVPDDHDGARLVIVSVGVLVDRFSSISDVQDAVRQAATQLSGTTVDDVPAGARIHCGYIECDTRPSFLQWNATRPAAQMPQMVATPTGISTAAQALADVRKKTYEELTALRSRFEVNKKRAIDPSMQKDD